MTAETRVSVEQADRNLRISLVNECPNLGGGVQAIAQIDLWFARHRLAALASSNRSEGEGWIVLSGDGKRYRTWKEGYPAWIDDRNQATRYLRRQDAEDVHREDEDAGSIVPFAPSAGVRDAGREQQAQDILLSYMRAKPWGHGPADDAFWESVRITGDEALAAVFAALAARPDGETLTERQRDNLEAASRYREGERETVAIPAGMKPWHGGDSAPDDWDGGPVLCRNGTMQGGIHPRYWRDEGFSYDVAAYIPSLTTNAGGDREDDGGEAITAAARRMVAVQGMDWAELDPSDIGYWESLAAEALATKGGAE